MSTITYLVPILIIYGMLLSVHPFFIEDAPVYDALAVIISLCKTLSMGILTAFIAFAIGDRFALVPAFVIGFFTSVQDAGVIQAIILAYVVGYLIKLGMKLIINKANNIIYVSSIIVFVTVATMLLSIPLSLVFTPLNSLLDQYVFNGVIVIQMIICILLSFMISYGVASPINKIAYFIAIFAVMTSGKTIVMASVMVAGMAPALGLGLSTLIFGYKFSKEEKIEGRRSLLFGLFFVTEGVLPFYIKHRKLVIFTTVLGSVLSGVLIAIFGIQSALPHGGILSVVFMSNSLYFLISLLAGVLVTALPFGLFWRPSK